MAIDSQEISKIATTLSNLAQNYNELAQNWFDIFYNPEARDITIKFFDTDGNLETYTLPNRAKDFKYYLNGEGDPSEQLSLQNVATGSLYIDTLVGDVYIKQGNYWRRIMSLNEVYSAGKGAPEGEVEGNIGNIYVDLNTGAMYLKTIDGGNTGWKVSGAEGVAYKADVDRQFKQLDLQIARILEELEAGVVHKSGGLEIISSPKQFDGECTFTDNTTFTKVIMGTSYRALSADIAEYYEADENLLPGTLVQFGGEKELTIAKDVVNAVVSTSPAYVLNSDKSMEHPTLIALTGRIPVRVKGAVHKFDYITLSDENGVAIVDNSEKSCYNRIGRALETNLDNREKLVECVVKLEL